MAIRRGAARGDSPTNRSLHQLLSCLVQYLDCAPPAQRASILLLSPATKRLGSGADNRLPVSYDEKIGELEASLFLGGHVPGEHMSGPWVIEDVTATPMWNEHRDFAAESGFRSVWSQAIRGADQTLLGAVAVHTSAPLAPDENILDRMDLAAKLAAIAIDWRRIEQERNSRLGAAIRMAEIGEWEWNIQTDEVWWSQQAYRLFGLDPDRFEPTPENIMSQVLPEDREFASEQLNASLKLNRDEPYVAGYRIRSSDGSIRHILARAELDVDAEGAPLRWVGVYRDATEQYNLRSQSHHAERLTALGLLVAELTHEIRNPISAACSAAETAKSVKDLPDSKLVLESSLETISNSVGRCQTIIQNVLRFARQESPPKERYDINPIILRACEATRHYTNQRHATIELSLADHLPRPLVNPAEIEQVLVNLIRNAAQAGEATSICVRSERHANDVRIYISDNGRGIENDLLDTIFDPFFTTNKRNGTGLGLALSQAIVKEHRGEIEVESTPGQGSTFCVVLPLLGGELEQA